MYFARHGTAEDKAKAKTLVRKAHEAGADGAKEFREQNELWKYLRALRMTTHENRDWTSSEHRR